MRYCITVLYLLLFFASNSLAISNESERYLDTVNTLSGKLKYFYISEHLGNINDDVNDTILHFAQEGLNWASLNQNDHVKGVSYLLRANYYVTERKFDSAFHDLALAEKYLEVYNDSANLGRVYNERGYVYLVLDLKHEGVAAIEKAINLAYGKAFDVWYVGKSNIAGTLMSTEPILALEIFNELKDTLLKRGSEKLGAVYTKIATLKRGTDSALYYYNLSIEFNRKNNNRIELQRSISRLATHYRLLDENEKAITHFKRSLILAKGLNLNEELFNIYSGLSFAYRQNKQLDSAEIYIDSMRIVFNKYQLSSFAKSHLLMSVIAQRYDEGNYKEAVERYTQWFYYRDSLDRNKTAQLAVILNQKMDDKEKDWKISLLREENKVEKWKFWVLVSLVVCIAIILSLGLMSFLRKKKSERLIVQLELEKERERKKRLELENQQKKKELISKSLQLSKKNQFLEELQNEIDQAINGEVEGSYTKLRSLIKINHSSEKEWEEIRSYFDQLSPHFFDVLENKSSTLSQADKKLAALIHLRIDNQNAANILHIARSSIKTARYRLKKKLGLGNEESLDSYLMNLG